MDHREAIQRISTEATQARSLLMSGHAGTSLVLSGRAGTSLVHVRPRRHVPRPCQAAQARCHVRLHKHSLCPRKTAQALSFARARLHRHSLGPHKAARAMDAGTLGAVPASKGACLYWRAAFQRRRAAGDGCRYPGGGTGIQRRVSLLEGGLSKAQGRRQWTPVPWGRYRHLKARVFIGGRPFKGAGPQAILPWGQHAAV
jgi:hypothetical protein